MALAPENTALAYGLTALFLTVGVRLYLFWNYYTVNNDGVLYIEAARHFFHGDWGKGLASFYPPLFPLLIAVAYPVTGEWELAGQFWPLALGILVLAPLFALLRDLFGTRVAWAALLFYSVSPYLARLSLHVRSEMPYVFFLVLALYCLRRGLVRGSLWAFVLAGINTGLAYLIRSEGVGLIIAGGLFLLYQGWLREQVARRTLQLACLVFGFILLAAPYVLYLKSDTGNWLLSRKAGLILSLGLAEFDSEAERVSMGDSDRVSLIDMIVSHPFAYGRKVFIDTFRSWGVFFEALHYPYLPFLLLGWGVFVRERFWQKDEFLLFVVIVFYLEAFSLLYVNRRYAVPLAALALGWVGTGFFMVQDNCSERWKDKRVLVMAFVVALFLVGTLPKTLQTIGKDKFYLREAGLYLKGKSGSPTIITTNQRVAFYAEGENRVLLKTVAELSDLVVSAEVDYLALDHGSVDRLNVMLARHGWRMDTEFSNAGREVLFVLHRPER